MKYYTVRIIAGLLFMGSFGCGMLAGAEYGKLIGWPIFISMATIGIVLDRLADKIEKV